MKIKSINVIETIDADTPTIHSFTADQSGRQQAADCFRAIAREQDNAVEYSVQQKLGPFTEVEIEEAITNRTHLQHDDGSWSLQIIESEWNPVTHGGANLADSLMSS